jgi:16S rRNA (guanine966-N2)-methyltransferase
MRIIGGRFRGHPIKAPRGRDTRPTTDQTREAIFNLVVSRISLPGVRALDLFAGTGALGLEAVSRGAAAATFVENAGSSLAVLRENVRALAVEAQCRIVRADVLAWLRQPPTAAWDLVLADPPYDLAALPRLPDLILPLMEEGGLLVLEHDRHTDFLEHPALETSRTYGRTVVSLFTVRSGAEESGRDASATFGGRGGVQ